ncbi:MAG: hypothetical protein QOF97_1791, partial [Acidimicrobiaceae bacterium]
IGILGYLFVFSTALISALRRRHERSNLIGSYA